MKPTTDDLFSGAAKDLAEGPNGRARCRHDSTLFFSECAACVESWLRLRFIPREDAPPFRLDCEDCGAEYVTRDREQNACHSCRAKADNEEARFACAQEEGRNA